ncbi:MAG: NAD-dependent epimerase/dehydratase family protein [Aigarchaeota archaeon]|nr:NAD-dependent epimerase/dehydratase family protein [Aigarchaeota archaeon]MDW8093235.1 NAD-dependent epimerase/dehydratase family protein [Nitrososphaerota archaeon]
MRVLITGSMGFVGRSLREYLLRAGYEVIGIDSRPNSDYNVDILDLHRLIEVFRRVEPDAVIHLAAISSPPACLSDQYNCFKVNVLGTLNVLEAAKLTSLKRFIYASSANVYGAPKESPVRETAPLNPRTPYDYSKVAAEQVVRSYSRLGVPSVILRSWKLFGEYDSNESAISRFIDACLMNRPLTLYNDGRDVTDPCYVDNFSHMVDLILKKYNCDGCEVFNVGTGRSVSIKELAIKIRTLTDSRSELKTLPPRSELESEPMVSYPSIEKASEHLGYRPLVMLEEGLGRVIEHRSRTLGLR